MLEETWKSLRESWLSRAVNPLSGAFAISWIVWNHRLLIALFLGDLEVADRFEYIDTVLYPSWWHFLGLGVIGPLASALAYIYWLPRPSRAVLKFTLAQKKDMLNDAKKIQGLELLTEAESQALRDEMFRLEADSQQRRKKLEEEISQWKNLHSDVSTKVRHANLQIALLSGAAALTNPALAQSRLKKFLTGAQFVLTFNPNNGVSGKKSISFSPDGSILEGKNNNENRWYVDENGHLNLIADDGALFSKFQLNPRTMQFEGGTVHPRAARQKQFIDLVSEFDEEDD